MLHYLCVFAIILTESLSVTGINASCTTPNGELATCLPLDSCTIIKQALLTGNSAAAAFYKQSQCGVQDVPYVCCGSTAFPVDDNDLYHFLNQKVCGIQKELDRVFGGEVTEPGEFPWAVLLGYREEGEEEIKFACGGTLISHRYVLSAAHCARPRRSLGLNLIKVRLGEWNTETEEDCIDDSGVEECADPVVDVDIENIIAHQNYSRRTGNNDIALIRLAKYVRFTEYIQPICLPTQDSSTPDVGTKLTVAGWGNTENGSQSIVKLKVSVPIVANEFCAQKVRINGEVTENQICAGGEDLKDACKGDSGGPLMRVAENRDLDKQQWFQEGVVSWGVGCGRVNVPAVYTKVSKYTDWIVENISN